MSTRVFKLTPLEGKINELEKKKIAYLEIDDKAGARRIQKQIDQIELEKELLNLDKIKKELRIYKEVVRDYPSVLLEINKKLAEEQRKEKNNDY